MDVEDKKGIHQVFWRDIRNRVKLVEPNFTHMVDQLSPGYDFPLYAVHYPYGAIIADWRNMYFPHGESGICTLEAPTLSADIKRDLAYGKDNWALGMVLEKNIEVFIDFKKENASIPWMVYKPGTIFPFARTLSKNNSRKYATNNILTVTSGVRSTFMLPNIGCVTNHVNLQRDFRVKKPTPKTPYEHWEIFKEIIYSESINSSWRSCLLYFSKNWLDHIHNDRAWMDVKMYLHELAWFHFEYRRNHIYYEMTFSKIKQKRNLKPNPYLADTATHLFSTALGASPGYAPAEDEAALPLNEIQNAYLNSYGLKKYHPIIMEPGHFDFDNDINPTYYSLQNPSISVFSPKARKLSSTLFELHELERIVSIFIEELKIQSTMCADTVLGVAARTLEFNYYHSESDKHGIVKPSNELPLCDLRFAQEDSTKFSSDAKFVRGCVSISKKPNYSNYTRHESDSIVR